METKGAYAQGLPPFCIYFRQLYLLNLLSFPLSFHYLLTPFPILKLKPHPSSISKLSV